jgi:hypothetical protein
LDRKNLSDQNINLSDIQTLIDLQDVIRRFNIGELIELANIEYRIQVILDWMDQVVQISNREVDEAKNGVQKAKQALVLCKNTQSKDARGRYTTTNCSFEENLLKEAEILLQKRRDNLETALSWRKKIQVNNDKYHRISNRLSIFLNIQSDKACSELQRLGAKYEAVYVSEQITSDMGQLHEFSGTQLGASQPIDINILQTSKDALRLLLIDKIRPSEWAVLDYQARLDALKSVENYMAKNQGRKTFNIIVELMPSSKMGYFDGKSLHLNSSLLNSDEIQETVNTVVHEGRHAYQRYAIDHPGFHSDADQVRTWRTNFRNYLDPEMYGYKLYQNQPVEKDAFDFADPITMELFK